jgi:uncharacterized Zn-binding protein involved in type VI secretion
MSGTHAFLTLDELKSASPERIAEDLEVHRDAMLNAVSHDGIDFTRSSPSPWGPRVFDFKVTATPRQLSHNQAMSPAPDGAASAPPTSFTGQEVEELMRLRKQGDEAPGESPEQIQDVENQESEKPEPPPRPDFDAPPNDWIAWYYEAVENAPEFKTSKVSDYSFDDLLEIARYKLIEQGTEYALDKFQDKLKDWLTGALSVEPSVGVLLNNAINDGASGDWLDWIGEQWGKVENTVGEALDKLNGYIKDPTKLFFEKALPLLTDLGVDRFFEDVWGVGPDSPAFERIAHMYAKQIAKGIVDTLLQDVASLDDLLANWDSLGADLKDQITKFFTGEASSASLGAARKYDTDAAGDSVVTGCDGVMIEGVASARATDLLFPTSLPITTGSGTVFSGGLPLARVTSTTEKGTTIASGAAQVFVGGPPAAVAPGGGLMSPAGSAGACGGGAAKGAASVAGNTAVNEMTADDKKAEPNDSEVEDVEPDRSAPRQDETTGASQSTTEGDQAEIRAALPDDERTRAFIEAAQDHSDDPEEQRKYLTNLRNMYNDEDFGEDIRNDPALVNAQHYIVARNLAMHTGPAAATSATLIYESLKATGVWQAGQRLQNTADTLFNPDAPTVEIASDASWDAVKWGLKGIADYSAANGGTPSSPWPQEMIDSFDLPGEITYSKPHINDSNPNGYGVIRH